MRLTDLGERSLSGSEAENRDKNRSMEVLPGQLQKERIKLLRIKLLNAHRVKV